MSRATRIALVAFLAAFATLWATLGWLRFASFHNQTFDLAFYARMAWGLSRLELWEPILGANVLGLHLSPVLLPIGWVGKLFGAAATLIVAQALFAALAAWPLARFGHRRLGAKGALLGAATLLVFPNLGHVASYEAHPGTLALLPLAWLIEAIDLRDARLFVLSFVGVSFCREDLALITAIAGLLVLGEPSMRRVGRAALWGSLLYFLVFALVLLPIFGPKAGSFSAHFGKWGGGLGSAVLTWLTSPLRVLEHLSAPSRLLYLPNLLAPVAFLPLFGARWLWLTVPVLGINLMSDFPTTTRLYSHYLTPALPFFGAAAIEGLARLERRLEHSRWQSTPAVLLALSLAIGHLIAGGTPLSADFDASAYTNDERSAEAAKLIALIPPDAPVQTPDELLPHLAERFGVHRIRSTDRGARFIVFDLSHRKRFFGDESLLRTLEEPIVRNWLAKDVAVRHVGERYLLLERGADPRTGLGAQAIVAHGETLDATSSSNAPERLCDCLELLAARRIENGIELDLRARSACPHDLALRLGEEPQPKRVELLFEGILSPAHLQPGDRLRSRHRLDPHGETLYVGALRSSGARPEKRDPIALPVAIGRAALITP